HDLLSGYAAFMRRIGHVDVAATALRTRSKTLRDVLGYIASNNQLTSEDFMTEMRAGALRRYTFKTRWLAAFGRVCALQAFQEQERTQREQDIQLGLACLQIANRNLPKDKNHQQFHRLEVELLTRYGKNDQARRLIEN